jgi:hypothetical protein
MVYNHLIALFNAVAADYNSDNPPVLQKELKQNK